MVPPMDKNAMGAFDQMPTPPISHLMTFTVTSKMIGTLEKDEQKRMYNIKSNVIGHIQIFS